MYGCGIRCGIPVTTTTLSWKQSHVASLALISAMFLHAFADRPEWPRPERLRGYCAGLAEIRRLLSGGMSAASRASRVGPPHADKNMTGSSIRSRVDLGLVE